MTPWIALTIAMSRAAAAHQASAVHAAVTIWHRWPVFAGFSTLTPAAATAEIDRAVAEKAAAFWLGGLDAMAAAQRLTAAVATGSVKPEALPGRLLAVSETAMGRARRTVRANARRLTRQ